MRFIGHVKARYGFSKGSLLVVPSRGDSMPYVVIEAAAAGIPMVAANVGGIPEIFGTAYRRAVRSQQRRRDGRRDRDRAGGSAPRRRRGPNRCANASSMHFSQKAMVEGVLAGYRDAFANR